MSRRSIKIVACAGGAILLSLVGSAQAEIACSKGFQKVQGSWLATPYCQDAYVAQVAHEYGFSATPAQIRNDPLFKQRLCRFIGQDIRVKETCDEVNPGARSWF
jgi:hypothetical protein